MLKSRSTCIVMILAALGWVRIGYAQSSHHPAQSAFELAAFAKKEKAVPLPACPAKFEDALETNGILPEGRAPGVRQPKPVFTPEAEFSDRTRKEINEKHLRRFFSVSLIAFVVDTDGTTRDLCVKKSGAFDLDQQAAKAVRRYRFEPATKEGQPVAITRITTEISLAIR